MLVTATRTVGVLGIALFALIVFATHAFAQSYTTVASSLIVDGDVRDGDVISYSPEENTYHSSATYADEMLYGVVVLDPVLTLSSNTEGVVENGVPVVRYGEAVVNVSTLGGVVRAGDLLTTSVLEGYAQRVSREDGPYILGFAIEDMTSTGETADVDGTTVTLGKVPVALRIGPHVTKEGAELISSSTLLGQGGIVQMQEQGGFDTFKLVRYVMASLVAALTILVATRRFGDTFSQSVVSVGRNPLARSQIRSMVIWNSILIIIISAVGFGISALILFLP